VDSDRTDEPFEFPKWTVSLGARKTWDTPIGELAARADYYWTSRVVFTGTNVLTSGEQFLAQDAYGLLAARLELTQRDSGLSVAIFGRNLLNKDYLAGGTDLRSLGWVLGLP